MIALRGLDSGLRPYAELAFQIANYYGIEPKVTSVYRSLDRQRELRKNWEECKQRGLYPSQVSLGPGMSCAWPANRPGDSGHNYGLAFDSWVPEGQMEFWKAVRRFVGWRVPDHDAIHAEVPEWRTFIA